MNYEKNILDLRDRVNAIEKKLGIEVWPVHKVGDMVVPSYNNNEVIGVNGWDIQHGSVVKVLSVTPTHVVVTGNKYEWFHRSFRPATSDEIAAHEQKLKEAEWAKVTELQDGDCCKVSAEEKKEIIESACEAGIINASGYQNYNWLFYRPNGVVKITGLREDPDPKWKDFQELTFTEFKRRLLGTIARLKAEAQAAEDAKLVFGARVKLVNEPNAPVMRLLGKSKGNYGYWNLYQEDLRQVGGWKRHEFTLLP